MHRSLALVVSGLLAAWCGPAVGGGPDIAAVAADFRTALLPFLFLVGLPAVATSTVLSVTALFVAGALLTRLTKRSPVASGMRMLIIGGGAGVLGYLVGSLLGVAVG